MKNSIIIAVISIIFSHGCENIDVVETRIDYREKIVVSAELVSGSFFPGVSFTRTLPVGETYDIKKAEILNINSYLRINFVKIVPLHYLGDGVYKPADSLLVESGDLYELYAELNGKSIYSKTTIPGRPFIQQAVLETDYIQASISPRQGEVYGGKWLIYSPGSGDTTAEADEFSSITELSESSGLLNVRTSVIPQLYLSSAYSGRIFIEVCSFDKPYMDYYRTRSNQNIVNNTFTQGGDAVIWNVYGDDVIGLFIGMGRSRIKAN